MVDKELLTAIANIMQAQIEPVKNELKEIRIRLDKLESRMDKLESRMDKLESRMDKLESRMDKLESRMDSLESRVDELETGLEKVKEDVAETRFLLENDISRKINVIGEGHDFLKQRLDNALTMEMKREAMELQLIDIQIEMKSMKRTLGEHDERLRKIS